MIFKPKRGGGCFFDGNLGLAFFGLFNAHEVSILGRE